MPAIIRVPQPVGPQLVPVDLNQAYSVAESCQYLRCSRSSFYKLLDTEGLKVRRRNGRVYVPGSEIARLNQIPQPGEPAAPLSGRGRGRKICTIPTPIQVVRKHK
jgi:Helix-turn-helix domain